MRSKPYRNVVDSFKRHYAREAVPNGSSGPSPGEVRKITEAILAVGRLTIAGEKVFSEARVERKMNYSYAVDIAGLVIVDPAYEMLHEIGRRLHEHGGPALVEEVERELVRIGKRAPWVDTIFSIFGSWGGLSYDEAENSLLLPDDADWLLPD
jgi:hypothetical protein